MVFHCKCYLFFDTDEAASFAVETFPSSLIISVVCLVGGVAEDELFDDLDGMWHDGGMF